MKRQTHFQPVFVLMVILTLTAGLITACHNNSPTNSSSSNNYVPMTMSFQDSIGTFSIVQVDIVGYPNGTTYVLPVTVSSGASTVYNFEIPAGVYYVNVYDNNNAYDGWSPVTLSSGTNFPVTLFTGSATLNSNNCNHCGI
jgi:hypothetical protein